MLTKPKDEPWPGTEPPPFWLVYANVLAGAILVGGLIGALSAVLVP